MTSIFHKIYSGEVTSYSIYRGGKEDGVLGATIVLDSNQHNLGQLVAFLGDQTVHDIKRTVELPPLARVVLNETVDFACELITARGVAPQAFLTRTEGQVLQAHLVARPVNYDSNGTNKDECLQTLFTGKRAASSEEMGNIRDKLSLTKEQKNYTNATFGANRRRRKAEYFYNWNCPNAKSVDDNTLIKQVSWFESDDK